MTTMTGGEALAGQLRRAGICCVSAMNGTGLAASD